MMFQHGVAIIIEDRAHSIERRRSYSYIRNGRTVVIREMLGVVHMQRVKINS